MSNTYFYIFFIVAVLLSILADCFFIKRTISIKVAVKQFLLWIGVAIMFLVCLLYYKNSDIGLKFISGYIVEILLSIDNIFVFILIFKLYDIKEEYIKNLLLVGILSAIALRIVFIAVGIELIDNFVWLIYIFGPFLIFTGLGILWCKVDNKKNVKESSLIRFIKNKLRFTDVYHEGRYLIKIDNKFYFSTLILVVLSLAFTDLVFAVDSIPTIMSVVKTDIKTPFTKDEILVIYSSNIFAILGLRALFVIILNMVDRFCYLQKIIGAIIIFVGLKMCIEIFGIHISMSISFLVIAFLLALGIAMSICKSKKLKI